MKTVSRLIILLCAMFLVSQPALAQSGEDTRNKAVISTDDGDREMIADEISVIRFDGTKVTVVQPWGETTFDRTLRSLTFLRPLPGTLRLTVTATLGDDNAANRAISLDGEGKLKSTWESGDHVYVYADATATEPIGTLTPETTGTSASAFTGDITADGLTDGQTLYFSTAERTHDWTAQTGTVSELFCATATATVAINGGNATVGSLTSFAPSNAVVRFTLTDGTNAVNAKSLTVSASGMDDITVTPASDTNILYVALPPLTAAISLTAITEGTPDRTWTFITSAARTIVAGNYYRTSITLAKQKLTVSDPAETMTTAVTAKKDGDDNQSYTGSALALVNAGTSAAGTLKYQMTTTNIQPSKSEGTWTTTVPTTTDAGPYYVWYYAEGNADYEPTDVCTTPVTVTIAQAANSFTTQPSITGWTYGAEANAPTGAVVQFGTPTYKYCATADGEYGTYESVVNGAAGTWYVKGFVEATTNYAAAESNAISFTISAATMTGITATAYNAAYDGAAHGITVNNVPDGATVNYSEDGENYQAANYTYTDVAAARTVYYKVSKTNYSDFNGSSTVTITQKALTVTAKAQTINFAGSITTGVEQVTAEGLVDGDELTSVTLAASTDQVTTSGTITPSDAATTNGIGNYDVTYNTGTLTINAVAATVTTAPTGKTGLVYNGSAQQLVNTESAACTGGTLVYCKTEDGDYGAASTITETAAGTYSFYYKVQGDANHSDSSPVQVTGVNIAQKALTVTAKAQTINFGGSITTGVEQVTAEGLVDGDELTSVTLAASTDQVTTSGTITPSDAATTNGIGNYDVTYNTGTLTINAVAATVTTAPTGKTGLVYNGSAQQLVNAESAACTGGTLVYCKTEDGDYGAASTITETAAGTYSFYYKVQGDANHSDSSPVQVTGVNIAQKALTITAKAQTINFGGSITTGVEQVTAEGLVDGDELTSVTLAASTDQVTTSGTITPSDAATTNGIGNYDVTYNTGTLTINAVAATVTTAPMGKTGLVYNGSAQQLVNAESAACTGGTLVYCKTEDGDYGAASTITETAAGTYSFYYKVQGDANHSDSSPVQVTGVSIAQKDVTISGITANDKTYNGTTDATLVYTSVTFDGIVGSDELTVTATGTFADANVGTDKTVTISDITLGGTSVANYKLAASGQQTSTTATITAATLTVTASDYSGTYDGAAHGITVTCEGATIKYGEAEGTYDLDASPTLTNAGTKTVYYQVTRDNYTTVTGSKTVAISKVTLTATAANASRNYGAANPSFTVNVTGFVNSETASTAAGYSAPTASTTATTDSNVGTYDITPNGGSATNYDFNYVNGTLTINMAASSITCNTTALSFSASNKANATTTKTGVSCSGGSISVSSSNTSYCTVSYSSGTITVKRVSEAAWSATITVSVTPDGNHTAPDNVTFIVSAAAVTHAAGDVESVTMGSYQCAKLYTSATSGYYIMCTDYNNSAVANWSTACGISVTAGGKTFTCGSKDDWLAIMTACGGDGVHPINTKCSGVSGWSDMDNDYFWSSTPVYTFGNWRFLGSNWSGNWGSNDNEWGGPRVRLVSAF